MTRAETLAELVLTSGPLLTRFLAGFSESTRTHQAPEVPNHAIWILGHCALTMHKIAQRLDGLPVPESDFVPGDDAGENPLRYAVEAIAFGSEPLDDGARYPGLERGRAIYEAACERLAAACRGAGEEALDEVIDWHGSDWPLWRLVIRAAFHNGTHAGQLLDVRRTLDLPRVIG